MNRQKDIQYSSRAASHIARQKQIHRLRHVIAELAERLPSRPPDDPEIRELAAYGCLTRMHVVRLLAPPLGGRGPHQGHRLQPRRHPQRAGRPAMPIPPACSRRPPGRGAFDPIEGFILHDASMGRMINEG